MARKGEAIREEELHNWKLLDRFRQAVLPLLAARPLTATERDQRRNLFAEDYFCAYLFAMLNPVVTSMRALCHASHCRKMRQVCSAPLSPASFSAAQHLFAPEVLDQVVRKLSRQALGQCQGGDPRTRQALKALTAVDGTLLRAVPRMAWAPAIVNRLKAEELREAWENLKRGTIENKEKVLSVALPEPPEADPLLGNIAPDVRMKVRTRFLEALERIYNPPAPDCAKEYLLGHVKGEARAKVLLQLAQAQASGSARVVQSAKRVREARENLDEVKGKIERFQHLPQTTKDVRDQLDKLNIENQEISRKLGLLEGEIRKLKSDLHTINEEIGRIQEELARLGPEQKRIAVAERIGRALDDLLEQLKPATTARLEEYVTKYFRKIADKRFQGGMIRLPIGAPPEIEIDTGQRLALEAFSGFEKRSFGIAFSLALAEITKRRIPLVIDTPLGNADSEYRPRTLKTLADFDLDQTIILTHDEEVTPRLAQHIESSIRQTFLVEFQESEKASIVHPNQYFNGKS